MTADYDVIIVGFGPVGQVAANLLGQRGYRVGVFEVASSIYNLPRAVHFDAEVMRIFQSVGLAEAVLPACGEIKGYDFVNADRQRLFGDGVPFPAPFAAARPFGMIVAAFGAVDRAPNG